MKLRIVIGLLLAACLSLVPAIAQAADGDDDKGALVRLHGDVDVPEGQTIDAVIVLDGNLTFAGTADVVIVVHGDATISGTVHDQVVMGNGTLTLTDSANVKDVSLYNGNLEQAGGATVTGEVKESDKFTIDAPWHTLAFIVQLYFAALLLVVGLIFAAIAGSQLTRGANSLTAEPSQTVIAAIVLWIVLPVVAFFVGITIIGLPLAFSLLFFMLALGFLGYFVFATRVGAWLLSLVHRPMGEHPYLAVVAGIVGLEILALIPIVQFIAGFVIFLGTLWGAGALALMAWRAFRGQSRTTVPMTPAA